MSEIYTIAVHDHPLIGAWLGLFFLLVLFLGGLHTCRIFARCLIVFVQEIKHDLASGWRVVKDLLHELTTWKSDP